MNQPVKLFTNVMPWVCPACKTSNAAMVRPIDVDVNDLDEDFLDMLMDEGELDDLFPDDEDFDEDVVFQLTGTIQLFAAPKTVQCGNVSCGEVYPARVMTVAESYEARKWRDAEDAADALLGE